MSVTSGKIVFNDFSDKVTSDIEEAILIWLEEASSELESQTATRSRSREVASKWEHRVDRGKHTAYVGNPLQNAIWEEFGTGEYALKGDGRKGYWVYVKGHVSSSPSQKQYTLKDAKRTMAYLRAKGLEAYYTSGQEPTRALHHAFTTNESMIKDALKSKLKGI